MGELGTFSGVPSCKHCRCGPSAPAEYVWVTVQHLGKIPAAAPHVLHSSALCIRPNMYKFPSRHFCVLARLLCEGVFDLDEVVKPACCFHELGCMGEPHCTILRAATLSSDKRGFMNVRCDSFCARALFACAATCTVVLASFLPLLCCWARKTAAGIIFQPLACGVKN